MRVLWLTAFIFVADQITKVIVKLTMFPGESIPIVGRLFRFTFTENPGMAFGLTLGSKAFLSIFSVVATFGILAYLWTVRRAPLGYRLGLALVFAGALGNVIDRVFYGVVWGYGPLLFGNVVDFLHVDLWSGRLPETVPLLGGRFFALFPIGNIADVSILIGIGLVLWTQKAYHNSLLAAAASAGAPLEPVPVHSDESPVR